MTIGELRDLLVGLDDQTEILVAVNIVEPDHGYWQKAVPIERGVGGWYDQAHEDFYFESEQTTTPSGTYSAICLCPAGRLKLGKRKTM